MKAKAQDKHKMSSDMKTKGEIKPVRCSDVGAEYKHTPGEWVKGSSGNPNGRPRKGMTMTETLREYMEGIEPTTGKSRRETVVDTLYHLAFVKKDVAALKYLNDRLDGTPRQSIDHGGLPPAININFEATYDEL